jgi:hypothetical protein
MPLCRILVVEDYDWESVYAVLAHKAGHNIMGHPQSTFLSALGVQLNDYMGDLQRQRQRIANREKGKGAGGYFLCVLRNLKQIVGFLSEISSGVLGAEALERGIIFLAARQWINAQDIYVVRLG